MVVRSHAKRRKRAPGVVGGSESNRDMLTNTLTAHVDLNRFSSVVKKYWPVDAAVCGGKLSQFTMVTGFSGSINQESVDRGTLVRTVQR